MRLKQLFRKLLPPLLLELYDAYRAGGCLGPVWDGVFSRFSDIPCATSFIDVPLFTRLTHQETQTALARLRSRGSSDVAGDHRILALLASVLCAHAGRVRILDFGGGMGIGFVHVISAVGRCTALEYHIVETPPMCAGGLELFRDDPRVQFHTSIPRRAGQFDIVYSCSALQYVDDYVGVLRDLCGLAAQFVLFIELSAGDVPTYVTVQRNVRGARIPYRFINGAELLRCMADSGYEVLFRSTGDRVYDQHNFPQRYRLGRTANILLATSNVGGRGLRDA